MRFRVMIWAAILGLTAVSQARAADTCESAFKNLKQLEHVQRHLQKLDIDRLLINGVLPAACSKQQIQFDSNDGARAEAMAPIAKAFVSACGRAGRHMAELELYSNDEVLHPQPGRWREGCGIANFSKPGETAPGTIAR